MLDNHQKQHLKRLAHDRKPVVIIGANGLTDAVLAEIDGALDRHELVKVRVNAGGREERTGIVDRIQQRLDAELVQQLGHVATFFRRNPETPRIELS
ncbi:MAG: ribosome assembly RNA-binding protein YhbY [Candidatus Competibacterales bacterium]|nr:ribosome assembly RNA-binding protein YhbY [Candidatus Competibacterales bacterium]